MIKIKQVFTEENMNYQFHIALKGKREHTNVIKFSKESLYNLEKLRKSVLHNSYKPRKDYSFTIFEPKMRVVRANCFTDKIIQGLLVNYVIQPLIEPTLIYDNYASRKGKGTKTGLDRLECFLNRAFINYGRDINNIYVLQCDIKKYFDNISLFILRTKISKLNIDNQLKNLLNIELRAAHSDDKGLCLGHELSQWFAIWYLNEMDHYIKESLKINYYGRYMDDFYLISNDKDYLYKCLYDITYLLKVYGLDLNPKKTRIYNISEGIKFLGFKFILTDTGEIRRILLPESRKRMHKKIKKWYKIINNKIDLIEQKEFILNCIESMESWRSHVVQGTNPDIIYQVDLYFYTLFYNKLIENDICFLDHCYVNGDYEYIINNIGKEIKKPRNKRDLLWVKELYLNPPISLEEALILRKQIRVV